MLLCLGLKSHTFVYNNNIDEGTSLGGFVAKASMLSMQGSWVPSLVREAYPTTKSLQAAAKTRHRQINKYLIIIIMMKM